MNIPGRTKSSCKKSLVDMAQPIPERERQKESWCIWSVLTKCEVMSQDRMPLCLDVSTKYDGEAAEGF